MQARPAKQAATGDASHRRWPANTLPLRLVAFGSAAAQMIRSSAAITANDPNISAKPPFPAAAAAQEAKRARVPIKMHQIPAKKEEPAGVPLASARNNKTNAC